MKNKCESHRPKYCLQTGGLRCRVCGTLLDDFGNEYKNYTSKEKKLAVQFGAFIYSLNCDVEIDKIDMAMIERDFEKFINKSQ